MDMEIPALWKSLADISSLSYDSVCSYIRPGSESVPPDGLTELDIASHGDVFLPCPAAGISDQSGMIKMNQTILAHIFLSLNSIFFINIILF